MEWFRLFIIKNFFLLCIAIVMVVISIQRRKQHPRISFYTTLIIGTALLLAVDDIIQSYSKANGHLYLGMTAGILGYVLRPLVIYFFILMTGRIKRDRWFFLSTIPLIINCIVFLLCYIPAMREHIYGLYPLGDGTLGFMGGYWRYISHVVSAFYLSWLIYLSIVSLKAKHFSHAFTILTCAIFVVIAVVIESFFNPNDDVYLLNTTIGISAIIYYLYLYIEKTQIDTLTGLFNREACHRDILKMDKIVTGSIQFDMNGLKYINDNYGHFEGDKALSTIANLIYKCAKKNMYAYRIGGDEFILLCFGSDKKTIEETAEMFKEKLVETPYYCSIGYSYRSKNENILDCIKNAEEMMYKDKAEFYKNSPFDRRQVR